MNETAKSTGAATADAIVWDRKKVWGSVGMTHYAEVVIGTNTYRFTLDQPRQHDWVARGWVNGSFTFYRDSQHARTLAGMKALVVQHVAKLRDAAKAGAK